MFDKTLIIIPCCGEKRGGEIVEYDRSDCIVNNLSLEAGERLMELRREVALAFQKMPGPDLGFENTEPRIKYMKAYERYSGHLYSKVSENSWNRLSRNPELRLVIVSALYGLVDYNEPIRYYNRSMKDHIYSRRLLKTWWSNHRLADILADYVTQNEIEVVHDFLSTHYSVAVWPYSLRLRETRVRYLHHTYPGLGSGSDHYRGREVNALIQNI